MTRRVHDRERAGRLRDGSFRGWARRGVIERWGVRTGAHRPEEEFEEFRAVPDPHGAALAGRYAEGGQHARARIHPVVELPIGRPPLVSTEQIDDRNFI